MKTKVILISVFIGLISNSLFSQSDTIDYLDQIPPADVPQIFAPGIVSENNRYEYGLSVSPNGKEIFFTCEEPGNGLMRIVKDSDTWSSPQLANLRKINVWEFEAFYTHSGDSLFFTSNEGSKQQFYYVTKTDSGWGEAKKLISAVNDDDIMWCSFADNGNMYYTKTGDFNSYCSKKVSGVYQAGVQITSGAHPYVSSDESFFLYNASGDIYIRLKDTEGISWGPAIKLNSSINTLNGETCPSLSPDGKYMFFSRYNDVGNKSDIYWVSTDFIEELKKSLNSVIPTFRQNIQFFPNPTKGFINIAFNEQSYKNAVVEINNIEGKQLLSNTFQNNPTTTIDISNIPIGIYIINLSVDGQKLNKKICIE
jgi:Tol biopolymer transport system component